MGGIVTYVSSTNCYLLNMRQGCGGSRYFLCHDPAMGADLVIAGHPRISHLLLADNVQRQLHAT